MNTVIHRTAVVEDGARLGAGVTVGPFAYVEAEAELGDGCVLGPHASVLKYSTLGPNCRVHAGAVIGDVPQDLGFAGSESFVRIGARCIIREGVTIHRGTKPGTATEVGDECFLMATAHVAHNVKLGRGVILANGVLLAGYVEVGDRAFLSGNCSVHQFCRIGRLAMMGGGSGASKDVPPFFLVRPLTMNTVAGINAVGLRRAGFTSEARLEIKRAFKLLYQAGRNVGDAVSELRRALPSEPVLELCDFIEKSKRGICRGADEGDEESDA
jgi:UDP-N-acetylglucosamine acyltransferase